MNKQVKQELKQVSKEDLEKLGRATQLLRSDWLYQKVTQLPGVKVVCYALPSTHVTTEHWTRLRYDEIREQIFNGEEYGFLRQKQEAELEEMKNLLSSGTVYSSVFSLINGRKPSTFETRRFDYFNESVRRLAKLDAENNMASVDFSKELGRINELMKSQKIYGYVCSLLNGAQCKASDESFVGNPRLNEAEIERYQYDVKRLRKCGGVAAKVSALQATEKKELAEIKVLLSNPVLLQETLTTVIVNDKLSVDRGYFAVATTQLEKDASFALKTRHAVHKIGRILQHKKERVNN